MRCAGVRLAYLMLLLQVAAGVYAQGDGLAVMKKICTAYNTHDAISFKSRMIMYKKGNPKKIIEQSSSRYILQEKKFACSSGAGFMLLNDKYYVAADYMLKLIVIAASSHSSGNTQLPVLNLVQFLTLTTENAMIARIGTDGATPVLQLTDTHAVTGCRLYKITYDKKTSYIKKIMMEMTDTTDTDDTAMILETSYSLPVANSKKNTIFSEKPFFTRCKK